MKKLFALAAMVVAATSIHAQPTLSGVLNYDLTTSKGTTTQGFGDSTIYLSASEQLGAGTSVTAKLGIDGGTRDKAITGRDTTIQLNNTTVGSLTVGRVEVHNGLSANTFGLASVIGSDGIVVEGKTNYDIIKYETPAFGNMRFSVTDLQSTSGAPHHQVYGATAAFGKLKATADYTSKTERVRLSGQYDLGVATVGAGWSGNEVGVANSYVLTGVVPIGSSFRVGGAYFNGNGSSYEVSGAYAFSKRTSVVLAYRNVNDTSVAANNVNTTRLRLQHVF